MPVLHLLVLVHLYFLYRWLFDPAVALFFAALVLLSLGPAWPDVYGFTRRLRIGPDGIRLRGFLGTQTMPWYSVTSIEARGDLGAFRLISDGRPILWSANSLDLERRKQILRTIRAWVEDRVAVEKWQGDAKAYSMPGMVFSGVGMGLLLVATALGIPSGEVLGIRCSVSSDYLRDRFDLPDERGCVVLRVSGPAERAGVKQGDLMIEMDGVPIVSGGQFSYLFEDVGNDAFRFKFVRSGRLEPIEIRVEMGPTRGPEQDRNDPLFYYLRARSDTEREHIRRDIEDYTRAIELAPGFDLAYMFRGELYQELDDFPAARTDYEKAIELSPGLGTAHRWLATLDQVEGHLDSALRRFERGRTLDECDTGFNRYNVDCAEEYLLLAGYYMGTDMDRVRPVAERSIEFYPGFPEPYYQLAVVHHFMDEDDEAARYAELFFDFPERELEGEKVASLKALLAESSFNCDAAIEDAPRWRCP